MSAADDYLVALLRSAGKDAAGASDPALLQSVLSLKHILKRSFQLCCAISLGVDSLPLLCTARGAPHAFATCSDVPLALRDLRRCAQLDG